MLSHRHKAMYKVRAPLGDAVIEPDEDNRSELERAKSRYNYTSREYKNFRKKNPNHDRCEVLFDLMIEARSRYLGLKEQQNG